LVEAHMVCAHTCMPNAEGSILYSGRLSTARRTVSSNHNTTTSVS
jgi:hypothetical protein